MLRIGQRGTVSAIRFYLQVTLPEPHFESIAFRGVLTKWMLKNWSNPRRIWSCVITWNSGAHGRWLTFRRAFTMCHRCRGLQLLSTELIQLQ